MTAPNMGTTITASIERSLQNCSLNHHQSSSSSSSNDSGGMGRANRFVGGRSSTTSDSTENLHLPNNTLELNSEIRLPYYWEQCLDLKTGEVYYINWRTGTKSQEDPRMKINPEMSMNGGLLCSEDDDGDEEADDSSYASEGSSTEELSPSTSRERCRQYNQSSESNSDDKPTTTPQVLVVAGCKSCFMYFMVPKQVEDCPKCFGQLLHFDRSENASP